YGPAICPDTVGPAHAVLVPWPQGNRRPAGVPTPEQRPATPQKPRRNPGAKPPHPALHRRCYAAPGPARQRATSTGRRCNNGSPRDEWRPGELEDCPTSWSGSESIALAKSIAYIMPQLPSLPGLLYGLQDAENSFQAQSPPPLVGGREAL